jgi:putative Mn2+ efflux pump MntP
MTTFASLFSGFPFVMGLVAASIHVLTGPDHLAAVGPLAINSEKRHWLIGTVWGMGHVLGMMIIGVFFFFFRDLIPVDFISSQSEKAVGIMLIIIGFWAFYRLYRLYSGKEKGELHHHDHKGKWFLHQHKHEGNHAHKKGPVQRLRVALGIGIVHGLAGVSHLLGLLPTLAFTTKTGAAFYLIGFAAGTLVAMGLFSFVMGTVGKLASEKGKVLLFRTINGVAGTIAVFVGVFWIWQSW